LAFGFAKNGKAFFLRLVFRLSGTKRQNKQANFFISHFRAKGAEIPLFYKFFGCLFWVPTRIKQI
jgi:hypothetical protein